MHPKKIGGGALHLPLAHQASPAGGQVRLDFGGTCGGKLAIDGPQQFFVG
jgi:hypothetical protein